MTPSQKLKVFRTPIGFHDAYVAAPSQKAALEAWGSDTNLFAAGIAELITDPKLTKEPLARPGRVIRKLRGTNQGVGRSPAGPPKRQASGDSPRFNAAEATGSASEQNSG